MPELKIGFIGAGQMARALARGFLTRQLIDADHVVAFDPDPGARTSFMKEIADAQFATDNAGVVQRAGVVVLAVKPQSFAQVSQELEAANVSDKLFISILAGVSLQKLCSALRTERVVRAMPNTPCLVGAGATAYAKGTAVSSEDAVLVERLFASAGYACSLPEHLLDAVTGLSGSGPAYVYLMIEAMSDGGVRMGLPRQVATALAAQTILGAARMVLNSGEHPGVLKDRVASPAGTTIAGLQILERRGLRSALIDAVEAATIRSRELGS